MRSWFYYLYALILGVVSWFTGEIVTFVMLGIILISLNNINTNLKEIYNQNIERNNNVNIKGSNQHFGDFKR